MFITATLALSLMVAPQSDADEPASAETKEATLGVAGKDSATDENKIICKRTAITGSKFKKKICGTKRQWETLQNRSEQTAQEWQRRGKGLEPTDTNKPGT